MSETVRVAAADLSYTAPRDGDHLGQMSLTIRRALESEIAEEVLLLRLENERLRAEIVELQTDA